MTPHVHSFSSAYMCTPLPCSAPSTSIGEAGMLGPRQASRPLPLVRQDGAIDSAPVSAVRATEAGVDGTRLAKSLQLDTTTFQLQSYASRCVFMLSCCTPNCKGSSHHFVVRSCV